ncbi:MAG: hypothetical protein ACOYMS_10890 [Terrimicrobiaceae bacterium]
MRAKFLQLAAGLILMGTSAHAQVNDVVISSTRKKLDEQKSRSSVQTITTKEYAYTVTVTNRSFKAIPQVEIRYIIFYEDAQPGSKEKPATLTLQGKESLTNLENNRPVTFETVPVKLAKSELDGNVYWTSGAKSQTKDAVTGVWFRAYADGKIVGENANPTTTSKKYDWKE